MSENQPATWRNRHRDPERWEVGCKSDSVRNSLVIPDLAKRIGQLSPGLCCDIGSGTGYITRALARLEQHKRVRWELLEYDEAMIEFSRASITRAGLGDRISTISFDITNPDRGLSQKYDFGFCCFSSLEFGMSKAIARSMMGLIASHGNLVLYLPDHLEEVAQAVFDQSHSEPINCYRKRSLDVQKLDRFTGQNEPYVAYRIEKLLSDFLDGSTACRRLEFLKRDNDRNIIVIEFSR